MTCQYASLCLTIWSANSPAAALLSSPPGILLYYFTLMARLHRGNRQPHDHIRIKMQYHFLSAPVSKPNLLLPEDIVEQRDILHIHTVNLCIAQRSISSIFSSTSIQDTTCEAREVSPPTEELPSRRTLTGRQRPQMQYHEIQDWAQHTRK